MPNMQTNLPTSYHATSFASPGMSALSDDECLLRLARAVEDHDSDHLDEVAQLIGRLAVAIE